MINFDEIPRDKAKDVLIVYEARFQTVAGSDKYHPKMARLIAFDPSKLKQELSEIGYGDFDDAAKKGSVISSYGLGFWNRTYIHHNDNMSLWISCNPVSAYRYELEDVNKLGKYLLTEDVFLRMAKEYAKPIPLMQFHGPAKLATMDVSDRAVAAIRKGHEDGRNDPSEEIYGIFKSRVRNNQELQANALEIGHTVKVLARNGEYVETSPITEVHVEGNVLHIATDHQMLHMIGEDPWKDSTPVFASDIVNLSAVKYGQKPGPLTAEQIAMNEKVFIRTDDGNGTYGTIKAVAVKDDVLLVQIESDTQKLENQVSSFQIPLDKLFKGGLTEQQKEKVNLNGFSWDMYAKRRELSNPHQKNQQQHQSLSYGKSR